MRLDAVDRTRNWLQRVLWTSCRSGTWFSALYLCWVHDYYRILRNKKRTIIQKILWLFGEFCVSHWFHETKRQRANSNSCRRWTLIYAVESPQILADHLNVILFVLFCRLFEVELWTEMQNKNLMIYDCQWMTFRARLTITLPLTHCVCVSSVFTYDIGYRTAFNDLIVRSVR